MNPIRVAVIGAGHLGKIHARLVSTLDQAKLIAVADPSPAAQHDILEKHDVAVISDYKKIISDIDAAIVATPTRFHFDVASELINQGKHVLIEKPMTDSVSDAKQLVEMAAQNNCIVQVGHCERFNAAIGEALRSIGTAKYVIAARMSGYTFRSTDIGVVHDLMIHDIDLVNSIFSGSYADVRASGFSVFGNHEDMAQARIQFDCGGIAQLTASRCSFTPERVIQIFGTKGYAKVNLAEQSVELVQIPDWISARNFDVLTANEQIQKFVRENLFTDVLPKTEIIVEPINAILAEQTDWLDAIRNGSQPTISAEQGMQAVEIADEVINQIDSHSWSNEDEWVGPLATPGKSTNAQPSFLNLQKRDAA